MIDATKNAQANITYGCHWRPPKTRIWPHKKGIDKLFFKASQNKRLKQVGKNEIHALEACNRAHWRIWMGYGNVQGRTPLRKRALVTVILKVVVISFVLNVNIVAVAVAVFVVIVVVVVFLLELFCWHCCWSCLSFVLSVYCCCLLYVIV